MKENDIKYFSSFKYSGKIKGFILCRESSNSQNYIVQPTHVLIDGEEIELKHNEIDLLVFHKDGLYDSYEDVILSKPGKIVNR